MAQLVTIRPEEDLLAKLAADGRMNVAETLVFLPNRRACVRLKSLLLSRAAQFLPVIMPLGELDELWLVQQLLGAGHYELAARLTDLPAPISAHEAHMLLAREMLEQRFFPQQRGIEYCYGAAKAIWQVFEAIWSDGKQLTALENLVRGDVSEHWRERLHLLRACGRFWQSHSSKHGVVTGSQRRLALARLLAAHWHKSGAKGAVIIAGSTGTQASTLALMQAVLSLDGGELWLQGVDSHRLKEAALPDSHPQALFKRLFAQLALPVPQQASADIWPQYAFTPLPAHIRYLPAADEQAEAALAALLAKEALARSGVRVAIVVHDAPAQRRLLAALQLRGLKADSAAAREAMSLPAMQLFMLIIQAMCAPADAHLWLSLFKQLGWQDLAGSLEFDWLRGRVFAQPMLARLEQWAQSERATDAQRESIAVLRRALDELQRVSHATHEAGALYEAHRTALLALLARPLTDNEARLLGELGSAMRSAGARLEMAEYAALSAAMLAGMSVLEQGDASLRLKVYTPIEARLMQADRWILCGLNEGQWPRPAADHPWLHPFLANQLALPAAGQAIALAAHDFQQLSAQQGEVFWLRSKRVGGALAAPSRWLERFALTDDASEYLRWLEPELPPAPQEEPYAAAPPECFPDVLSVSAVGLLLNNPYGFYAKYILRLRPLDPIDRPADGAQRGDLVHLLMQKINERLNNNEALSLALYHEVAGELLAQESSVIVRYQWAPRLFAMANNIVALEQARRADGPNVYSEQSFKMRLGNVVLQGRADRVEQRGDDICVIDYKSGAVPALAAVKAGFEPQLPLLAMMQDLGQVRELAYWSLSGIKGEVAARPLKLEIEAINRFYREGLTQLFAYYRGDGVRYRKLHDAQYDDYTLLARVSGA